MYLVVIAIILIDINCLSISFCVCVSVCLSVFRAVPVPTPATSSSLIYWEVINACTSKHPHWLNWSYILPTKQFSSSHLILVIKLCCYLLCFLLLNWASVSLPQWPLWDVRSERWQWGRRRRRRRSPWRSLHQATSETFCTKSITPWEAFKGETQCSQCNSTFYISWKVIIKQLNIFFYTLTLDLLFVMRCRKSNEKYLIETIICL